MPPAHLARVCTRFGAAALRPFNAVGRGILRASRQPATAVCVDRPSRCPSSVARTMGSDRCVDDQLAILWPTWWSAETCWLDNGDLGHGLAEYCGRLEGLRASSWRRRPAAVPRGEHQAAWSPHEHRGQPFWISTRSSPGAVGSGSPGTTSTGRRCGSRATGGPGSGTRRLGTKTPSCSRPPVHWSCCAGSPSMRWLAQGHRPTRA